MKKLLIAAAMVAFMASSSFAAISLDLIGLAGVGNDVWQPNIVALSFDITKDLSVAVGAGTSSYSKPDYPGSTLSDALLYLNGYYTIMRKGDVSQAIGAEFEYSTYSERDGNNPGNYLDLRGNYRVTVNVTPSLAMMFDVEVLALVQYVESTSSTDITTSSVTILNGAKIGFSVPIM